ncbi:uncharacterized protein [Antedon mediterranea]|uniref:uncharacterized protein n=1 Tax=Antedon mediterranea TaxID=105859 RepID=UPI003AF438F9
MLQRVMDGFNEFIIEDGQYLRLAILNIQSGSQGWYTCASPIISKSVFIQVNIPCSIIQPPSNGFLQGSNWRAGATVTCECGENYVINCSAIRHCLPNGEWTGEECSCVVLGCDKFEAFGNGTVEIEGEHLIGGLLRYSCAPDFQLVGESVLECAKSGMWNGSLPTCEDICANNTCTDDKKCVVRQREATCISKTSDDCPLIGELVCGSDAVTYSNKCLLKVTACSTEKVIDVMHNGRCINGISCHANPVRSDVQCVNQIYFRSDIKVCVQVADGFCMQSDEGFRTVDECEDQCMGDYDETCSQAVDSGFGPFSYLRFYYDQQESKCMSFE